jgi:hypothetical protein
MCTAGRHYVVLSYIPTLVSLTKAGHLWAPIVMCEAWSAEGSALELSNVVGEVLSFAVRECFSAAGAHMLNQHTEHISVS